MDKKLLILFCMIFLIGNLLALENLGIFKQDEIIRISQVCSDASYITISSVTFPNSTTAISNINITSAGSGEFYYNFINTSTIGRYDVRGISDGCEGTFATYFEITASGRAAPNQGEGTIFLASIISMILITILFFAFSFTVKRESGLRFGFLAISLVMSVITTLYSSVALMEVYGGFSRTLRSFSVFQYILLSVLLIIFIFVLVSLTVSALNAWKIKKGLKDENE